MTSGSASSVTLATGTNPTVLPDGTYTIVVNEDSSGVSLTLITPLGTVEVPSFIGQGWA